MEKKICEDCLKNEQVLQRRLWQTLLIVHDRLSENTLHHEEDGKMILIINAYIGVEKKLKNCAPIIHG